MSVALGVRECGWLGCRRDRATSADGRIAYGFCEDHGADRTTCRRVLADGSRCEREAIPNGPHCDACTRHYLEAFGPAAVIPVNRHDRAQGAGGRVASPGPLRPPGSLRAAVAAPTGA